MPRFSIAQHAFNGGELAPEVMGRTDVDKYDTGATSIENFIVTPEGGLHRRHGTRHVEEVLDSTFRSRLVPFVNNDGASYILEFSDRKIRAFSGTSKVMLPSRNLSASEVNLVTGEFTFTDHGYAQDQGPFQFVSPEVPPGPLFADTDYWVSAPRTNISAFVTPATDVITLISDHGWVTEMGPFRVSTDYTLPTPLSAFQDYYIEVIAADEVKLRTTPAGAPVNITTAGVGTLTIRPSNNYVRDTFRLSATQGGAAIALTTNPGALYEFTPNPNGDPSGLQIEIPTGYPESDLGSLQFAQSTTTLYIVHPNHRPSQLRSDSSSQWSFDEVAFIDGPYLDANQDSAKTITASVHTLQARTTLTLSSADIINDGAGWSGFDIGRIVRIAGSGGAPGYVEIDSIVSSTVADGIVMQAIGGTPAAHSAWRLGVWYGINYPSSVALAEQRLCFAGEMSHRNFVTTSNAGSDKLTTMRPSDVDVLQTVIATNSVRVGINDVHTPRINWLSVGRTLIAGTDRGVVSIRGSLDGETFSPTNVNAVKVSSVGTDSTAPVNASRETVYVTRNSQGARAIKAEDFGGNGLAESYPEDLSLLSRHIFGRSLAIEEVGYQFDRRSIVWFLRSDGVLIGCTYVPEQDVFAWHSHIIGGSFSGSSAVVESVAVDSSTGGSFDRVWLIVKRTVNSSTVRYIEYFEDEWLDGDTTNQYFVDSHPQPYSGSAQNEFDTYAHLIGETVAVLGDGAVLPDAVITEPSAGVGRLTTSQDHTSLVAGFGYTSTFESVPYEVPDEEGSSLGKMGRCDHAVLRLWNSLTGEIGVLQWHGDVDNWTNILERGAGDVHGSPPAVFTGDKKVALDGGFDRQLRIRVRQTQPVGFHLLAMNIMGHTGQR